MKKRVVAIVQARMGSTRLPGKVLKEVLGKPLLGYLIDRVNNSRKIDDLVIATSVRESDDVIAAYCASHHVKCYRGSEDDVLSRYIEAAILNNADYIVRICSDSPLIDPAMLDEMVDEFLLNVPLYDYLSNTINQTYPLGMNAEIFSFGALQEAHLKGTLPCEREHVTPYIYGHPDRFKIGHKNLQTNLSKLRLTVDVAEDFVLVKCIIERLYPSNPNFGLSDILALFKQDPELFKINFHIQQKTLNKVTAVQRKQ